MSIAILFWVIMVMWLLFGAWTTAASWSEKRMAGGFIVQWVLFALLGWAVFGAALHK